MRGIVRLLWVGVVALAASAAHASGDGLQYPADDLAWEGLKGRLLLGTSNPSRSDFGPNHYEEGDQQRVQSLSVMGDYYFTRPWLGSSGGLRATSGLVFGPRNALWSSPSTLDLRGTPDTYNSEPTATLPYVGIGYTGLSRKGGWGLSADLGLMGVPRSSLRLGTQSLDDTMRDLRFTPLFQLGLSYSF